MSHDVLADDIAEDVIADIGTYSILDHNLGRQRDPKDAILLIESFHLGASVFQDPAPRLHRFKCQRTRHGPEDSHKPGCIKQACHS